MNPEAIELGMKTFAEQTGLQPCDVHIDEYMYLPEDLFDDWVTPEDIREDQMRRIREVLKDIESMLLGKNPIYVISPVEILDVESWLHQIRIKAERALQVYPNNEEKAMDDMRDGAIYNILALARMRREW